MVITAPLWLPLPSALIIIIVIIIPGGGPRGGDPREPGCGMTPPDDGWGWGGAWGGPRWFIIRGGGGNPNTNPPIMVMLGLGLGLGNPPIMVMFGGGDGIILGDTRSNIMDPGGGGSEFIHIPGGKNIGMGMVGEYGKRVIWRRLGMTTKLRDRVYEISGSDPVKIAIMGAELTATPTSA